MLSVRLPQSIEKRLEKLARRTGRTKTYYVRETILEHLEDLTCILPKALSNAFANAKNARSR